MDTNFFEIFTLVTGLIFLVLEIRQSNWMWLMQFLSSAAAIVSFVAGGLILGNYMLWHPEAAGGLAFNLI